MKNLSDSSAIDEALILAETHLESIRIQSTHLSALIEHEPRRKWNLPSNRPAGVTTVSNNNTNSNVKRGTASNESSLRGAANNDPELHRFRRL
jgi:hypothetical protein